MIDWQINKIHQALSNGIKENSNPTQALSNGIKKNPHEQEISISSAKWK